MFNLIIAFGLDSFNDGHYELERSRVAIEYTEDEISERYRDLGTQAIAELKSFPTLFVIENEETESRLGHITNIRVRKELGKEDRVIFDFELDTAFRTLPRGAIKYLTADLDLGRLEISRTHWAVKNEPLFDILIHRGYVQQNELAGSRWGFGNQPPSSPPPIESTIQNNFNKSQVFIVHGHDGVAKLEISEFISSLGLEPIILHQKANLGMSIFEKIKQYSDVGFAVVLYTPCDVGFKKGELIGQYRARQNVVFEHGFLVSKIGSERVAIVVKDSIELPNDISGKVYISMELDGEWKQQLLIELRELGYQVWGPNIQF